MRKTLFSPQYAVFTRKLVALREQARLTQRDLAKRLKRHHSVVGKVEEGQRRLDVLEFMEWTRALGHDPTEVLTEIERDLNSVEKAPRPLKKSTTPRRQRSL